MTRRLADWKAKRAEQRQWRHRQWWLQNRKPDPELDEPVADDELEPEDNRVPADGVNITH